MMKGFERGRTVLEFDKVLENASACAYTEGGKKKILGTVPSEDRVVVERLLDETTEALNF
ncbi:MAG: hypothetical protein KBS45_01520 [Clostridiales bacterium]|nr:hypothetical protein [Candidatus Coliplasma caballi]